MKAYKTQRGIVLTSAITAVDLIVREVYIYAGNQAHLYYSGAPTDAKAKYDDLIADLGWVAVTSE